LRLLPELGADVVIDLKEPDGQVGEAIRAAGGEPGIGKIPFEVVQEEMKQVWSWIADEKIDMEIEEVPLAGFYWIVIFRTLSFPWSVT
jgi:hypothetical protein